MHKNAKIFENHLNPVMLVFIGKLSPSTHRWVPICRGVSEFSGFLLYFVLAKLASSSIRAKTNNMLKHVTHKIYNVFHHTLWLPVILKFTATSCSNKQYFKIQAAASQTLNIHEAAIIHAVLILVIPSPLRH